MASSISAKALMLLHSRGDRCLRFPLKNGVEFEHSENLGMITRVRATGGNSLGTDEDKDGSEGVFGAINKKRNKVLALQKDLLQQVVEIKKLVSSEKSDNILESEVNSISYELGNKPLTNKSSPKNASTRSDNAVKNQNENIASPNSAYSSKGSVKAPFVGTNGSFNEAKGGDAKTPPEMASYWIHLNEKLEDKAHETIRPDTLLALFANGTEHLNLEVENQESVSESAPVESEGETEIPPPLAGTNVMNVILVAAECAPWSKTGGLGDVVGSLPKALSRRGHRVMVVTPRYGNYAEGQDTGVRKTYRVDGHDEEVRYFHAYIDGVDFVFVDSPFFHHLEHNIYGGSRLDILKRMVLFCKAAVEVPWHVPCGGVCYGDGNLAFIANDWHTALLPVYLKAYYRDQGLMKYTRSVLVIHNIAHQGRGPVDDFFFVDLPEHHMDLFKLYDPIGGDHFNIFAAGLKTADRVVTVSHGYAWELKTSEGGWGLHRIIKDNDWKLRGIVNGIDNKDWNPRFDVHLKSDGYTNYSLETLSSGKGQCKAALQKELGLPIRDNVPVIAFIGRLDQQKGVDLIAEAIPWLMSQDVQLIMLGTGRPDLEHMLRQFESQHHDKIRGWVGFSVKMAHRITAGSDILLMPSRFEPCGLNQLYAMNYGTVPVVHAVGGLKDTVQPFDPFNESGLGWTFESADSGKLSHALGNCLLTYREYKKSWEGLQKRGMTQDLSWDNAAQLYEEVLLAAKYQW
ncbi:unnamed protein product [Sphenostylis stenocarpa]|uniref:starch synthase n=1 Tax=Sphenostylis stenocarpa TaxID=92480 RepID=A0AA86V949_9FABA|nr:unnamed protein product [Sphenostylis stenocarpa]